MVIREKDISNNPEELSMEEFRQEIREIREKEEKGEIKSSNLIKTDKYPAVDENMLKEEDREIWIKLKNKELTIEDYRNYRTSISSDDMNRQGFAAFIGNKLQSLL